jgi:hypothetical protein
MLVQGCRRGRPFAHAGSALDDFCERHRQKLTPLRVRNLKTVVTGIAPMPDRFDPHLRCGVKRFEIRGLDIREINTFLVTIDTVRGVEIEEKQRNGRSPLAWVRILLECILYIR